MKIFYTSQFVIMQTIVMSYKVSTPFELIACIVGLALCWAPWFLVMKDGSTEA